MICTKGNPPCHPPQEKGPNNALIKGQWSMVVDNNNPLIRPDFLGAWYP